MCTLNPNAAPFEPERRFRQQVERVPLFVPSEVDQLQAEIGWLYQSSNFRQYIKKLRDQHPLFSSLQWINLGYRISSRIPLRQPRTDIVIMRYIGRILGTFDGSASPYNSYKWLTSFEAFSHAYRWPEYVLVETARYYLQGHAKQWYLANVCFGGSWRIFRDEFMERFVLNKEPQHIRLQIFYNRQQGPREQFVRYVLDKVGLGWYAGLEENLMKTHIEQGLNSDLMRVALEHKGYSMSLKDAIMAMEQIEWNKEQSRISQLGVGTISRR